MGYYYGFMMWLAIWAGDSHLHNLLRDPLKKRQIVAWGQSFPLAPCTPRARETILAGAGAPKLWLTLPLNCALCQERLIAAPSSGQTPITAGILSYSTLAVAQHREGMNERKPLPLLFSLKSILFPHSVWFSWKHLFQEEMFLKQRALFELMEWKHLFKRQMLITHFCYPTASRNTGEKHPPLNPAAVVMFLQQKPVSARSSDSFGASPVLSSLRPVHLCLPLTGTLSKTSLRGSALKLIHLVTIRACFL